MVGIILLAAVTGIIGALLILALQLVIPGILVYIAVRLALRHRDPR